MPLKQAYIASACWVDSNVSEHLSLVLLGPEDRLGRLNSETPVMHEYIDGR